MSLKGFGVGLRSEHYPHLESGGDVSGVDWFEAITENYLDTEGRPFGILERIRARFPLALHGVSLSIGSAEPVSPRYLRRLRRLVRRIEPDIVSDHLCWTRVGGEELHDLLPLPFTEEALRRCVEKIQRVQEAIGRLILIENVSSYISYRHSEMTEWEFLNEVTRRSGAGILLDLNNVFVNARNHGFDPYRFVAAVNPEKVRQFHLAGYTDYGDFLFDTHNAEVSDPVWRLYAEAAFRFPGAPTLIEWDEKIPEFRDLVRQSDRARQVAAAGPAGARIPGNGSGHPETAVPPVKAAPLERVQNWVRESIRIQEPIGELRLIVLAGQNNQLDRRFSVYSSGYRVRIGSAVTENFPATKYWLGEDRFAQISTGYADRIPSRGYNLSRAADRFPSFVDEAAGRELPFVGDLARFELELARCFHAPARPSFGAGEFAQAAGGNPEALRIRFQPHLRLFESPWAVLELWRKAKEASAPAADHDPGGRIQPRREYLQIFRRAEEVFFREIAGAEFAFLSALAGGRSLGVACEAAQTQAGEETAPVGTWMSQLVADGLLWRPRFSAGSRAIASQDQGGDLRQ